MTASKLIGRKIKLDSSPINISFFDQIAIVLISILALSIALTAHVGLNFYKDLKEDSLKSIQFHKVENIKNRLENLLSKDRYSAIHSRTKLPEALTSTGIKRFPEGQERVIVFIGEAPFVIGSHDESSIWVKPLTNTKTIWNESDGFTYLVTREGKLIASNTAQGSESTLKKSIDIFFRSKLNDKKFDSNFIENSAFKNSLMSHSRIEKTNIIIVNETNVSGYLTFFKNFSFKMYLSAIMGAILVIGLAIFFEIRFVRSIENILALVDNLKNTESISEPTTKLVELELLFEKMASLSREIYNFEEQLPILESFKSRFALLFEEIVNNDDKSLFYPKIFAFTTEIIQGQHGKISATLYEFPHRLSTEIHGQHITTKFRKICFVKYGIIVESPNHQRVLDEGFELEESQRFCFRAEPQLLSDTEARFPVRAGDESIGFVVYKGDNMEYMAKPTIEWIMLSCQLIAHCFRHNPRFVSLL